MTEGSRREICTLPNPDDRCSKTQIQGGWHHCVPCRDEVGEDEDDVAAGADDERALGAEPRDHGRRGHREEREGGVQNPHGHRAQVALGVDRALEVLRGAVGGEDEEERGGEDVQVAGVATAVARVTQRRGAGEERRRGRLLLLVAVVASSRVHGPRRRRKLLEAIDPRGLRREAPSRRPFIERVE